MIQTVLNGMITLMMARFIVNDLPHAAGLLSNPGPKKATFWIAVSPHSWGGSLTEQAAIKSYYAESATEAIGLAKKDSYFQPYFDKIRAAGYMRMSFSWGTEKRSVHRHMTASFDVPHAAGVVARYKTMYHTTPLRNWENIRKEGLTPQRLTGVATRATGLSSGVYLETDLEAAYGWAGLLSGWEVPEEWEGEEVIIAKFAILEVKIPENEILTIDPDVIDIGGEETPTAFISTSYIPPERIRLHDTSEVEIG